MIVSNRRSRVAVVVVALGTIAAGGSACFAWLQSQTIKQQLKGTASAPRAATFQPSIPQGSSQANQPLARAVNMATTVQNTLPIEHQKGIVFAPHAATFNPSIPQGSSQGYQTPGGYGSMATTVRITVPIEQQRLVAFILSQPKEGNAVKKAEARAQLTQLVEVELAERFANQAGELEHLEKRVVDAKSKLTQRRNRKQEIIARRISELLVEPDELAWNGSISVNEAKDRPVPNSGFYNTPPVTGGYNGHNYSQNTYGYRSGSGLTDSSPIYHPAYTPAFGTNSPVASSAQYGYVQTYNAVTGAVEYKPTPTSGLPLNESYSDRLSNLSNSITVGAPEPIVSLNAQTTLSAPPSIPPPASEDASLQVGGSDTTIPVQNIESKSVKARFGNDLESLSNEAIEVESDLEELEGLTANGKAEAIQRLALRKRIKQLELRLDEASKDIKRQQQSHRSALELAKKELDFFEEELEDAKGLLSKGAMTKSECDAKMLDMERAKFKIESLKDEQVAPMERLMSISDRVNLIRKKLDESIQRKALPETAY